ncbi:DUF6173 family protein [Desulfosporosinus sp. HMP52]|uniref:DUF6173 family protein n=1 Tax=Desulfosporosinus sp. HMP52 TaxID=1487923 RepID=UPI000AAB3821|nr:DUF6173 family protein [Desulfosporosinus sp. HMP52]
MDDFLPSLRKMNLDILKDLPMFTNPQLEWIEQNLASEFCKKIYDQIVEFDSKLDNDKQVAVRLVNFGQSVTFVVNGLGYSNPSLIRFSGTMPNGSPVELIQHVSQISFLLTSSLRDNPTEPKQEIGFKTE